MMGCIAMNVIPPMIKIMLTVIINSSSENPRFDLSLIDSSILTSSAQPGENALDFRNPIPRLQGVRNAELSAIHALAETGRVVACSSACSAVFILGRAGGDVKARRCNDRGLAFCNP